MRSIRSPLQARTFNKEPLNEVLKLHTDLNVLKKGLASFVDSKVKEMVKRFDAQHSQHSEEMNTNVADLKALQRTHYRFKKDLADLIDGKLKELEQAIAHTLTIQKGPPGEPGASPSVDYSFLEEIIKGLIPKPVKGEKGDAATIDHTKLAGEILNVIKEKKLIKASHIDGWEDPETILKRVQARSIGMRGGGDTVAAGSNITISTVNGVKTISAPAGSGITELAPTETPNGSTTVFTFAAATAQPSYIVSDNVWQKATSKAGTVNWTWNAGAKQATLIVAPVDDLYGIV